jgi:hypothetical protein
VAQSFRRHATPCPLFIFAPHPYYRSPSCFNFNQFCVDHEI